MAHLRQPADEFRVPERPRAKERREARLALSDQRKGAMRMVPGARIACRPQSTR
jgi:hypothetical protein